MTDFPFTFQFVPATGEKPIHALKRKKGEFVSVTAAERYEELQNPKNTKYHATMAKWQEDIASGRRAMPDRKNRVCFADVKVKNIVIDEEQIQYNESQFGGVAIYEVENNKIIKVTFFQ